MKEKVNVFQGKIKQKGVFNYGKFYKFAYDWLRYDGYDIYEKQYLEEIEPAGKKVIIQWTATKRISDYFAFELDVFWFILRMNDIEVIKEGQKVKGMKSGEPEITVKAILVKDHLSKWNTPFLRGFKRIYDRYMFRTRIADYQRKVVDEAEEFIRQCKEYLTIEGYPESHPDYLGTIVD